MRIKEVNKQQQMKAENSYKQIDLKSKQRIVFRKPQKQSIKEQQIFPPQRAYHISMIYRSKLYIWGGSQEVNSAQNLSPIFVYDFETKLWRKIISKNAPEYKDAFLGQCHTVINSRWYLFGEVKSKDDYLTQLWKLNLDSYEWVKCDQKNQIPEGSEGGCLVGFQKNWLIHYRGYTSKTTNSSHHLYIYSIDSKNWHSCEGDYEFILKFRIGTSICVQNGKVYMFGGARQSGEHLEYLNDFYELTINTPTKYSKAKAEIRIIEVSPNITARAESYLFPIQKDYICILGGRNLQSSFSQLWIYNLKNSQWIKDSSFNSVLLKRDGFSCAVGAEELFLFGGMEETNERWSYENDLWSIKIGWDQLNNSEGKSQNTEITFNNACCLCYQKHNKFMFTSSECEFNSAIITGLQEQIQFPFAAFGLLIDNSILLSATQISIQLEVDINNQYFIKIQDNGKNHWNDQQLLSSIANFCPQTDFILQGTDKKIKKHIVKENLVKQFGVNLKLGGFRLGKRILYISIEASVMRVYCFNKTNIDDGSQKQKYTFNYYGLDLDDKKLIDQGMKASKQQIEYEYGKFIRQAMNSNNNNKSVNMLYIFETNINNNSQQELTFQPQTNNLIYGNVADIKKLQQMGYHMKESIDTSLRAYLSNVYLRSYDIRFFMGGKNNLQPIHIQGSLDQIDRFTRLGMFIELRGLIDFDFKFREFYYPRDLKPHQTFFNNGLLLYSKNRLIARYKVPLGEMVNFLLSKHSGFSNYLPLLGFAELPQNIPVNASKTNFCFSVMLQKMQSRLKFVDENFKRRSANFIKGNNPRNKPNMDEDTHKTKKSILQLYGEKKTQSRKRECEFSNEQSMVKKSKKKQLDSQFKIEDFVSSSYMLRERDRQLRSKKQEYVLIEHVEESQAEQNRK